MNKGLLKKSPMVIGLVAGIAGIPFSAQISKMAISVSNLGNPIVQAGETLSLIMLFGSIIGLLSALLSRLYPVPCGFGFTLAAILAGISLQSFHWISLAVMLLFFAAAAICFLRRKDAILQLIRVFIKKGQAQKEMIETRKIKE